jgi:hypothetical protein
MLSLPATEHPRYLSLLRLVAQFAVEGVDAGQGEELERGQLPLLWLPPRARLAEQVRLMGLGDPSG